MLFGSVFRVLYVLLLLICCSVSGQTTATIVGIVTDASGAAVSDAQVTGLNAATQFSRTVETNASGQYVIASISTGDYTITVARPGFQKLERSGVQLTPPQSKSIW